MTRTVKTAYMLEIRKHYKVMEIVVLRGLFGKFVF